MRIVRDRMETRCSRRPKSRAQMCPASVRDCLIGRYYDPKVLVEPAYE